MDVAAKSLASVSCVLCTLPYLPTRPSMLWCHSQSGGRVLELSARAQGQTATLCVRIFQQRQQMLVSVCPNRHGC